MFSKSSVIAALISVAAAAPVTTISSRDASCPVPASNDTTAQWLASTSAPAVPAPANYTQRFVNLNGATQDPQYITYQQISTYDPSICAAACNTMTGCNSFNIYLEYDPAVNPTDSCPLPASSVGVTGQNVIKCSYYRSIIDATTATNNGQWREQFQVAVTGSAGYTASRVLPASSSPGYVGNHIPSDMAINAPLNADGTNPLAGAQWWTDGQFSVDRCAQACTTHSNYVRGQQSGSLCNAFNTYIQTVNGQVQQMCTFYTKPIAYSLAVNGGNGGSTVVSQSFEFTVANYNASAPAILTKSS